MLPSPDLMQCAPNVAPQTIAAIIHVESGGNPQAIGINGLRGPRPHPKTPTEAARLARYYIARGYSVDLGLMQINSRNLPGLGETIESILEPCHNIRAGSHILSRGYAGATRRFGPGQDALKAALSAYNTGNYELGFRNGYVAKYYSGNGLRVIIRAPHPFPVGVVGSSESKHDIYHADSTVYSLLAEENKT